MDVTTVAGSTAGHEDGQGAAAKFNEPGGVACCPDGSTFVSEVLGHCVRAVSAGGAVTTFAGSGSAGFRDGQGPAAQFNRPNQMARDIDGNLYLADTLNNRIRKITPGGLVTTVAGTGAQGARDGHCSEATFRCPYGLAISPATGNLVVADSGNHRIRVIVVSENIVYTLAGGAEGFADGVGAAAKFNRPVSVACDAAGDVLVADSINRRVRKIKHGDRAVTTLAGDGTAGFAQGAGAQAQFIRPLGIVVDSAGNAYVADASRVYQITPAGVVRCIAGGTALGSADGQGPAASFHFPMHISVDAKGNILVADRTNHRLRLIAAGAEQPASLLAAEPAAPGPEARVAADLAKLLDEGEESYSDVAFLVDGETIHAHKSILSARCEYFATMLGSGFAEGTGGASAGASTGGGGSPAPLPVADTTPAVFRALLRFLYAGAVDLEAASAFVVDLASLSQRYLVDDLQAQCTEFCAANVTPVNAVPWLVAADAHAIAGLRDTLLAFVVDHYAEIEAAAPDAGALLQARPGLMLALFRSSTSPPAKRRKTGN